MSRASIRHTVKKYGNNAMTPDLNALTRDGELFTPLGPSGCGKATLLRMIAGFNSIEGGDICFNGIRTSDMDPSKHNTGMTLRNYAISPNMTVRGNVVFGLKNRRMDKDKIKKQMDKYLNLIQIIQYAERMPNQFSGGQQQCVALARALVIMPDALLMDGPLSNLGAKLCLGIRSVIRHAQKDVGITAVYVTHDQEEAMIVSDTIAVMKDGAIQHVGSSKDIYQHPKNIFVATFIGRINIVPVRVEQGVVVFSSGYRVGLDCLKQVEDQEVLCSIQPEEFVISSEGSEGARGVVKEYTYLDLNTHRFVKTEGYMTVEVVEESSIGDELRPNQKVLLQVKKHKINLSNKEGNVNFAGSKAYEG